MGLNFKPNKPIGFNVESKLSRGDSLEVDYVHMNSCARESIQAFDVIRSSF